MVKIISKYKMFIIAKHSSKQFYLLLLSLSLFLSSLSLKHIYTDTYTHSWEYGMGVQFYIHGFMITYHADTLIYHKHDSLDIT